MKIAHLILTHANPAQLKRLLLRLSHPSAYFYIHIDGKTDISDYLFLKDFERVYLVANRVKVYWGGYSIVQATLNAMGEIVNSGIDYGYINLLSGQDYPLKSVAFIHDFFERTPHKAFMHTLSVYSEWQEAIPRVTRYHLANMQFKGKYQVECIINAVLPKRRLPSNMEPVGRSQWFTISLPCVAYIVRYIHDFPAIAQFFKYCWAPDELIFQTILHNSPLRSIMINDNLRYIDWSNGGASPKTLLMDDAPKLMASGKFFARKFNPSVDEDILNYLDKAIDRS